MIAFRNNWNYEGFKNYDVAIFVIDGELSAFSYEKTVKAKVVSRDLTVLIQACLCSVCRSTVAPMVWKMW